MEDCARRYSVCVFRRERSYIVAGYVLRVTESLGFLVQVKYNVRLLLVLSRGALSPTRDS